MILGIETSCDDTSAAVFDGRTLRSNVISTQLIHQKFGGVVPELASRSHIRLVLPVIREALGQADVDQNDIQGIAVTYGPGLCFQDAVFDVLVEKAVSAAKKIAVRSIGIAGGVAVNKALQDRLSGRTKMENISVFWPSPSLCTDNGGMIARAGYYYLRQDITSPLSLSPIPSLNF